MLKTLSVAAIALIATPATASTTFALTGNDPVNGTYGNAHTFVSGGINVRVSGWQATPSGSGFTVSTAYLARFGSGLGVTGQGDNNGGNNLHTIDNQGRFDFVLLQFDRSVTLTGARLTTYSVGGSLDNDAFISAGLTATPWTTTLALNTLPAYTTALFNNGASIKSSPGTPSSRSFASYGQAGNVWIVGADFFNTDGVDGFKLSNLVVSPAVPEPETWAMLIAGFGMIGATVRRRTRPTVRYA